MSITDRNTDRALLVLRLAMALILIAHGQGKLAVLPKRFVSGYEPEFLLPMRSLTRAFARAGAYSADARLAARES